MSGAVRPSNLKGHLLLAMIRALLTTAFPFVLRLAVLIAVFHGVRFLIRTWKGLGKQ